MHQDRIEQYTATRTHAAVLARDSRGLLELTGDDRAKWLNNLVTNLIVTLQPGEGNYAFVINIKGRVQFDLIMLVRPDRLLLDIDNRLVANAAKFLSRYIITEKVEIKDRTADTCRVAVIGPRAHETVTKLSFGNLTPMAWLQNVEGNLSGLQSSMFVQGVQGRVAPANSRCHASTLMFRHDFTGQPGAEFILFGPSRDATRAHIIQTARECGAIEIDPPVAEILRIEAGIPASVDDIDEEVIPPETGQIERGISHHKGCYLGQEVIERMRSHKILARKLVGVKFDAPSTRPTHLGPAAASANASTNTSISPAIVTPSVNANLAPAPIARLSTLFINDAEVGRTMSGCLSPALGNAPLSLAYIKTAHANPGTRVSARTQTGEHQGTLIALPVSP